MYPGAEHTRFAHSLGVTHLMRRFIDKILSLKDLSFKTFHEQIREHRLLALTSAFLHDIGTDHSFMQSSLRQILNTKSSQEPLSMGIQKSTCYLKLSFRLSKWSGFHQRWKTRSFMKVYFTQILWLTGGYELFVEVCWWNWNYLWKKKVAENDSSCKEFKCWVLL